MDNTEMKPCLSLGYDTQASMIQQGGQQPIQADDNGAEPSFSGEGSLHNPIHVSSVHANPQEGLMSGTAASPQQSAIQLMGQREMTLGSSRDLPQHHVVGVVNSGAFVALGTSQRVKRRMSPLHGRQRGNFRTPSPVPSTQTTAGRNPAPSNSHPIMGQGSSQTLQQLSQTGSGFQCVVGSEQSLSAIPRPIPSLPANMGHSVGMNQGPYFSQAQYHDHISRKAAVREWGNKPLALADPDLWDLMEKEKNRQWKGIELIASENFTSQAVIEALGSHLTNKYSEGLPGVRYYKGNQFIDQIESLCCSRALMAFHLDPEKWGVNVQPYSCSSANFAVYTALLQPNDRIMGLDVLSGGHLSHGYYTQSGKKISAASIYFQTLPFKVHPKTGRIDYEKLEETVLLFRPKILICGGSSYPREWDYAQFRQIADKVNAILMCDMAHISGLVVAQECNSPFDHCDIVTSTTHKSLRGPRGGMIFYRKGPKHHRRLGDEVYSFERDINFAIHPTLQGGPHNNHIAALATSLKQAATPEYKAYMQQVKRNAQVLAEGLKKRGCELVTDGTDNHLILVDLRPCGVTGNLVEEVCEACHITVNKNVVYGEVSAWHPGGIRIGVMSICGVICFYQETPAMTSRGCTEVDFDKIAAFLHKAVQITMSVQKETAKLQREFVKGLQNNSAIAELRASVEKFASSFEMPGFEVSTMKYMD